LCAGQKCFILIQEDQMSSKTDKLSPMMTVLNTVSPVPLITELPGVITPKEQATQLLKSIVTLSLLAAGTRLAVQKLPAFSGEDRKLSSDAIKSQLSGALPILNPDPNLDDIEEENKEKELGWLSKNAAQRELSLPGLRPKKTTEVSTQKSLQLPDVPSSASPKGTPDKQEGNVATIWNLLAKEKDNLALFLAVAAPLLLAPKAWSLTSDYLAKRKQKKITEEVDKLQNELDAHWYSELQRTGKLQKNAANVASSWLSNPLDNIKALVGEKTDAVADTLQKGLPGGRPGQGLIQTTKDYLNAFWEGGKSIYALYAALLMVGGYYSAKHLLGNQDPNKTRKDQLARVMRFRGQVEDAPQFTYDLADTAGEDTVTDIPLAESLAPVGMSDKLKGREISI
jgi:hypothetical protein